MLSSTNELWESHYGLGATCIVGIGHLVVKHRVFMSQYEVVLLTINLGPYSQKVLAKSQA